MGFIRDTKMLFLRPLLAVVCSSLLIAGCATYNAATGRNEFIFVPTGSEVTMGQDMHNQIQTQYTFSTDSKVTARLNRIGQRLAVVSDRQDYAYQFHAIEKDDLNAFTTPGGHIYVYTGLMDKLESDDALAGVIAHEIGHCAARHTIKKFQAALGIDLVGTLLLGQIEQESTKRLAAMGAGAAVSIAMSAYSRQDEHEADRLGVKYLYLAGFKPEGMVQTLEVLQAESKDGGIPLFLRSHPYLKDRVTAVKAEILQVKTKYPSGAVTR